jgi:hypothetical protein
MFLEVDSAGKNIRRREPITQEVLDSRSIQQQLSLVQVTPSKFKSTCNNDTNISRIKLTTILTVIPSSNKNKTGFEPGYTDILTPAEAEDNKKLYDTQLDFNE